MKTSALFALPVALMLAGSMTPPAARASSETPVMKVFKSPSCGCCKKWVERVEKAGFKVEVVNTEAMDTVKKMASVPENLQACHTASIDGYVVEGHVPPESIRTMLKTRPRARGIAVPGMPTGSPGMEYGNEREAFNVVLFGSDGPDRILKRYPAR
jgi:hypothetical protein